MAHEPADHSIETVFHGSWRITSMEMWDQDAFDMVVPAHFTFDDNCLGHFQFIAVEGDMDCRFGERDGQPQVEFSWSGDDDGHPTSGRGWAVLDGDAMTGRIFLHRGDDSAFTATRQARTDAKPKAGRRKPPRRG